MIRWGSYERTEARLADGTRLEPIPIARFRCPEHGTTSWLPPFLNRYLHYVAEVVSQVLDDFVHCQAPILCDGPDDGTLARWVADLLSSQAEGWLHRLLEQADASWRSLLAQRPTSTRPIAWQIVQSARVLTRLTRPNWARHLFSPFLQLASLSLRRP